MDPLVASIVANAAAGGGNVLSQIFTNRANRRFAERMYNRQRADALEFWRMQNTYNSPVEQMRRFKEAGLNPHLIYDKGSAGLAGPVSTPTAPAPMAQAPDFGFLGGLVSDYYNVERQQIENNNARKQGDVIAAEEAIKRLQIPLMLLQRYAQELDLDIKTELRQTSIDAAKEALRSLRQSIDLNARRDEREQIAQAYSIQEAVERVANMRVDRLLNEQRILTEKLNRERTRAEIDRTRAEIDRTRADIRRIQMVSDLVSKDVSLRQLDLDLKSKGLSWSDPIFVRIGSAAVDYLLDGYRQISKQEVEDRTRKIYDLYKSYEDRGHIVIPRRPFTTTD